MNGFWACFLPLGLLILAYGAGWWHGTYGFPIQWVGFSKKRRSTRVSTTDDE
jgi:hypothetical protein